MKYKKGDILSDKIGDEMKILGVFEQIYFYCYLLEKVEGQPQLCNENKLKDWTLKTPAQWVPEEGGTYFFIDAGGLINEADYEPSGRFDIFCLSIGNMNKTERDAEAYKHKLIERMGK